MVLNEVVVFPSNNTLDFLLRVFKNSPFNFDEAQWFVTLNECYDPCAVDPSRTYTAHADKIGLWYNDELQASSLILELESPDLIDRMVDLRLKSGSVFHPTPLAFMPLVPMMPPLSHHYKAFINSVDNVLTATDEPLIFTGEVQRMRDIDQVPYSLYYEDHGLI